MEEIITRIFKGVEHLFSSLSHLDFLVEKVCVININMFFPLMFLISWSNTKPK